MGNFVRIQVIHIGPPLGNTVQFIPGKKTTFSPVQPGSIDTDIPVTNIEIIINVGNLFRIRRYQRTENDMRIIGLSLGRLGCKRRKDSEKNNAGTT